VSKGEETRERIVEEAVRVASRDGLEGLTIGTLAAATGLSKSGLFAHFGSKEDLQLEALRAAVTAFEDGVMRPAFRAPRGLPRLRKIFELWIQSVTNPGRLGGCLILAAGTELDDKDGPLRDYLVEQESRFLRALAQAAKLAVDAGHFRADLDREQFAFEAHSIVLGYNHARRLLRDPQAEMRARAGFDRLLEAAKA
jgi:AcrR family transcriptional regulator